MALKADIAAPPFLPSQMRGGTQVGPGISCWIQDGWKGDMSLLGRGVRGGVLSIKIRLVGKSAQCEHVNQLWAVLGV